MNSHLDPNDVRLFSGRSNPDLAQKIADFLSIPLSETHVSRFSNDNLYVQLGESVRGRAVYIVQSLTSPVSDHLMELLMMLDIAKSAAAREVHAIIPYFSYARSDCKDAPRISITARLVADLLKTAGATHVMTMTLHSPQVQGFFSVPTDPLTARTVFVQHLHARNFDPTETIVVAPDAGQAKPAGRFAKDLGLTFAVGNKTRISDTVVKIDDTLRRQVAGFRQALVYEDEIATGGTITQVGRLLVDSGIQDIVLICTHGLFLGRAFERIHAMPAISEVLTTDTVKRSMSEIDKANEKSKLDQQSAKLTELSVGAVFGAAIVRNYVHESIGDLFSYWGGEG
ncbi:ribose-phosphate pyrophosphokinase [Chloroflexi bacterium TSY]|nr:ribose-phosphate pyrophosphokinase [Chloroflexi bacterium TSY]